jgi:pentatricopeptide repeat protein
VVLSAHARRPTTLSLGKSLMTTGAIRAASTVANEKARATFDRLDEVLARGALFDFKSSPLPTPDEFFGLKPIKTVKGAGKQADGAPVTPAQEIAAAHAAVAAEKAATKGADDDFSQFRPRRGKGSADGLGKDGASEAPAVVVDHSSNTFEALYEGRTGYETDEEMAPVEDYNAPYRHTKHIRALLRAYDEKDLDAVLELYYGNKRDPLTMRAELEAAIAKQDEELSREVDGDDGDSLVTAGQNQTTKSELDDDARAVGPDYLEYDIVLDACAKAGRLDIAMSIVDDLVSEHGLPTPSVLTLLLKGAAIANDVNAAVRLWETFQSSGCALNAHAYAAIIGVHMANGNSDEAFALFNK